MAWPALSPELAKTIVVVSAAVALFGLWLIVSDVMGRTVLFRRRRPEEWISCAAAIDWMLDSSKWGRTVTRDGFQLERAAAAFEEAAREGAITVRGRPRDEAAVEALPPTYWETAGLDVLELTRDRCQTESKRPLVGYFEHTDLQVPARQVRRRWPAPYRLRSGPEPLKRAALALALIAALAPAAAFAGDDCDDATDTYNRRMRDLAYSAAQLARCVESSRGHDDCSSEFSRVRSDYDDFESAVRRYKSDCD